MYSIYGCSVAVQVRQCSHPLNLDLEALVSLDILLGSRKQRTLVPLSPNHTSSPLSPLSFHHTSRPIFTSIRSLSLSCSWASVLPASLFLLPVTSPLHLGPCHSHGHSVEALFLSFAGPLRHTSTSLFSSTCSDLLQITMISATVDKLDGARLHLELLCYIFSPLQQGSHTCPSPLSPVYDIAWDSPMQNPFLLSTSCHILSPDVQRHSTGLSGVLGTSLSTSSKPVT